MRLEDDPQVHQDLEDGRDQAHLEREDEISDGREAACDEREDRNDGADQADQSTSLFGLFDGMTSTLGMILALAFFGTLHALVTASVAAGVCAGASMGAGQWQQDPDSDIRRASIMGLATLVGCLAPAVPLYIDQRWPGYVACGLIVCALAALIAHLRPQRGAKAVVQTFALLLIVTGLGVLIGWATGQATST